MIIIRWICYALALIFTAWIVPGIEVAGFMTALLACIVIALINTFVKPVIEIISLPVNVITIGLFSLVINALLFMLAGWLTPGIEISGFWSALMGSIVLSVLGLGISKI